MTILQPEILIIGAGPSGAAAAWGLAQAGHDVLMVDAADFPRDKTCGDGLTPMAIKTLDKMGVLDKVEAAGAFKIDHVSMRGPYGISTRVAFEDSMGPGHYALVLPRLILDQVLYQHAIDRGVGFMGNTHVIQVERAGNRITSVQAESPDGPVTFEPRQVIIAVGANIGFLKRQGFLTHPPTVIRAARTYYARVHPGQTDYSFYFERNLVPGYGWVFPTGPDTANIGVGVFSNGHRPELSTKTLLDTFVTQLQKRGLIKTIQPNGPIKGYPIRVDFPSERVEGENWLIVGESTGLVNPVTGEGIDLAMESGLLAAETIHEKQQNYQQQLETRYASLFNGLRWCQRILMNRALMDYALWQTRQHRFVRDRIVNAVQGFEHPQQMLHPWFILQFLIPLSPTWVFNQMRGLFKNGHR